MKYVNTELQLEMCKKWANNIFTTVGYIKVIKKCYQDHASSNVHISVNNTALFLIENVKLIAIILN